MLVGDETPGTLRTASANNNHRQAMAANSSRPQALDAGITGDMLEGGLQLMGHYLRNRWPQE